MQLCQRRHDVVIGVVHDGSHAIIFAERRPVRDFRADGYDRLVERRQARLHLVDIGHEGLLRLHGSRRVVPDGHVSDHAAFEQLFADGLEIEAVDRDGVGQHLVVDHAGQFAGVIVDVFELLAHFQEHIVDTVRLFVAGDGAEGGCLCGQRGRGHQSNTGGKTSRDTNDGGFLHKDVSLLHWNNGMSSSRTKYHTFLNMQ